MEELLRDILVYLLLAATSAAVGILVGRMLRDKLINDLQRQINDLKIKPSPINITNNLALGVPPKLRFGGAFLIGHMYYPGRPKENRNPTILIPEIYIEHQDGKKEPLNIEGFGAPDGVEDAVIAGGIRVRLGTPKDQ